MSAPFDALQKELYDRLTGDIDTTVIDYPDEIGSVARPYIEIGEYSADNEVMPTSERYDVETFIHVYTDQSGMREVNDIMDAIKVSIMRADIDLTAYGWDFCLESVNIEANKEFIDGRIVRHGQITLSSSINESE